MSTLFAVRSPCTRVGGPRVSTLIDTLPAWCLPRPCWVPAGGHRRGAGSSPGPCVLIWSPVSQRPFGAYSTAYSGGANRGYQLGYHALVTSLVNTLVTSVASLHAVGGPGQAESSVNGWLLGLVVGVTPRRGARTFHAARSIPASCASATILFLRVSNEG